MSKMSANYRKIVFLFLQQHTYRTTNTLMHRLTNKCPESRPFGTYLCSVSPKYESISLQQHQICRYCSNSGDYKTGRQSQQTKKTEFGPFADRKTNDHQNQRKANREYSKRSIDPSQKELRQNFELDQDDMSFEFSEDGKSPEQLLKNNMLWGEADGQRKTSDYPGDEYFVISEECSKPLTHEHRRNLELLKEEVKQTVSRGHMYLLPSTMTDKMWHVIADCPSKTARRKMMSFFFKREMIRINEKAKKNLKKAQNSTTSEEKFYHYILNPSKTAMKMASMQRQYHAWQEQTSFIVDMRYCDNLSRKEMHYTAMQLQDVIHYNNKDLQPFHLMFCNFNGSSENSLMVKHELSVIEENWGLFATEPKNYLDIYPKEKLVYLSPHSSNVLREYDKEKIYIMGGIVDLHCKEPVTMQSAYHDDVTTACLPLKKYLKLDKRFTILTLNQVFCIMLDLNRGLDWKTALRHVPSRKSYQSSDIYKEKLREKNVSKSYFCRDTGEQQ